MAGVKRQKKIKKMIVVCDIDGVLADVREEVYKYLPNWTEYYRHTQEHKPIVSIIEVIQSLLAEGNTLIFVTGRPGSTRKATKAWLLWNILYLNTKNDTVRLTMRKDGDFRPSVELKLDACRKHKPDLVLEDEPGTVKRLAKEGFTVLQVYGYRATKRDGIPYLDKELYV